MQELPVELSWRNALRNEFRKDEFHEFHEPLGKDNLKVGLVELVLPAE